MKITVEEEKEKAKAQATIHLSEIAASKKFIQDLEKELTTTTRDLESALGDKNVYQLC